MTIRTDLLTGFSNRDFFRVFIGTLGLIFVAVAGFAVLSDDRLFGIDVLSPATLYVLQDYVYGAIIVLGVYILGVRMARIPLSSVGFRKCSWDWMVRGLLVAVFLYSFRILIDSITIATFDTYRMLEPAATDRAMLDGASVAMTVVFAFGVTVVTPIATELFQRGIFFAWMRRNFNFFLSSVASAVIFGPLHIEIIRYAQVIFVGVFAAYLYEKSRSIWPVIAMHMSLNMIYFVDLMGWQPSFH